MTVIKKGDLVALFYEGRFENGELFDSSNHGGHEHPLEFTAGEGQVVLGFDKAVIGMKKGEEKEFKIKPSEAYGERDPQMEKEVPRSTLPQDQEPKAGMTLVVRTPDNQQFPVKITAVTKEKITLDLNHPLAGKNLVFKIKIEDINHKPGKYAHNH